MSDWSSFLSAMTLTLVRVSGMVLFAPFFSATAIPIRVKAIFSGMVAFLVAPLVAQLPGARINLGFSSLLGELAVGLVYGLALALLNEMMLFAGQIAGMQFSFSLVNLLDPASNIQTPLLGELFQLMGTLVVIAAGLDRILLASMVRSFRVVPLGAYTLAPMAAMAIVRAAAGIFLAAVEPAAPILAPRAPTPLAPSAPAKPASSGESGPTLPVSEPLTWDELFPDVSARATPSPNGAATTPCFDQLQGMHSMTPCPAATLAAVAHAGDGQK